jgi:5-(carboxyamino)imidazole ribonucleotide synthase
MNITSFYNKKIGILGGGQLGKMLCTAAAPMHLNTYTLEPTDDCPASVVCKNVVKGDFTNFDTVYNFGKHMDVITIEIEKVNVDALIKLKQEGKKIYPSPEALQIIQDKGLQKQFYKKHNLKTSAFELYNNKQEVADALSSGKIKYPFVQKSRTGGYDGKGVSVINNSNDLNILLEGPCVIEEKISFSKELSVIAARDIHGNVKCFDVVEMVFDEKANLVTLLLCPAKISNDVAKKAEELAIKTINAFEIVGLLAVELFLDSNNEIYINEVAPRPHNSGHHTIEACVTSQYEQHLRAILELPLGSTEITMPAVMINLLGEAGYSGAVNYKSIEKCLAIDGAKFHIYGKAETKPFRKMGHVTIIDKDLDNAIKKAEFIQKELKIIAF